jgi:PhzF family phenazine biosynthesis protein
VFTRTAYAGNPATVVFDGPGLDDTARLALARDYGTSETVFLSPRGADGFPVRFFTPEKEVPSCGHGALATACIIDRVFGEAALGAGLECKSGHIRTGKSAGPSGAQAGTYTIDVKATTPRHRQATPESLANALGVRPNNLDRQYWYAGAVDTGGRVLLAYHGVEPIWHLRPDQSILCDWLKNMDANGVFLFEHVSGTEVAACRGRYFAPVIGLTEDPVNGNSAAALFSALATGTALRELHVEQGVALGRAGHVQVHRAPGRDGFLTIEGAVTPFAQIEGM